MCKLEKTIKECSSLQQVVNLINDNLEFNQYDVAARYAFTCLTNEYDACYIDQRDAAFEVLRDAGADFDECSAQDSFTEMCESDLNNDMQSYYENINEDRQ